MPVSAPNTLFAGTAGPKGDRPGPDGAIGRFVFYLMLAVVAPLVVAVYALWLWVFFFLRAPWWAPSPLFVVGVAAGVVRGWFTWPSVQATFVQPWLDAFSSGEPVRWLVENSLGVLAGQAGLSVAVGSGWALVACAYKWWRRPQWKERHLKPGPFLRWRYRRTVSRLEAAQTRPENGVALGVAADTRDPRFAAGRPAAAYGRAALQSDGEAAAHTLVVGASGSGKTTTLFSGMRDVIKLGRGLIVVDIKGGPDVPEQLAVWAGRYGRKFYHWSFHNQAEPYVGPADRPAHWDPVSRGDPSRRKDLILGSQVWDVEFYKSEIANYLQTMFTVMDLVPPPAGVDNFTDIADLLNPTLLLRRAAELDSREHPTLAAALSRIADIDPGALSGVKNMYSRFNTLSSGTGGPWLRPDADGVATVNLYDAAVEGHVVVFSLDSNTYQGTAELVAGLVIQDLITVSAELRHRPAPQPVHVYVDEFGKAKSDNMKALLAQARDARMFVTVAAQNLSQLEAISAHLSEEICGTVGAFVVHRVNTEDEARYFAGLSGVRRKHLERTQVEQTSSLFRSLGAAANVGSAYLEEVDEANVLPGQFQDLARGEFVYLAKSRQQGGQPVYVCPVKSVKEKPSRVHAVVSGGSRRWGAGKVAQPGSEPPSLVAGRVVSASGGEVSAVAGSPDGADGGAGVGGGFSGPAGPDGAGVSAGSAISGGSGGSGVSAGVDGVGASDTFGDPDGVGGRSGVVLRAADADVPDVNVAEEPGGGRPAARPVAARGPGRPGREPGRQAQSPGGGGGDGDVFWDAPASASAPARPVPGDGDRRPRRPGEPVTPPGVPAPGRAEVPVKPKPVRQPQRRGAREAGPYWDTPDMP